MRKEHKMHSRRDFVESVAAGVAGTLMAPARVLGANDRIRIGVIGLGDRGKQDTRAAISCPDTEVVGVADVYTRRLEEAKQLAPNAKTYLDYRRLLEDRSEERKSTRLNS